MLLILAIIKPHVNIISFTCPANVFAMQTVQKQVFIDN